MSLPVEAVRDAFARDLADGPVVLSSPTGSGKSTQVPRWCAAAGARVLVIEPRRVACSSLATYVSELEASAVGERVGYWVRDDSQHGPDTRILFATPGIVLRQLDRMAEDFDVVVFDEFHERRLDTDLLLALLRARGHRKLVIMSATIDGDRIATHLEGRHLEVHMALHPVAIEHVPGKAMLPDREGLEARFGSALRRAGELAGDVLVFLPGKAEIAGLRQSLEGSEWDVSVLHGDLSLGEQGRVFRRGKRRRVILTTNVAETSVTVPGIGVVIDSGLVRRTRYRDGRGFLALVPVALDSADQRKGRAGRTGPGHCLRLWSEQARLEAQTPPEMHRESLVPLLLACAEHGTRPRELAFVDAPEEHALIAAESELSALGAIDTDGAITAAGREIFGLPLDAHLARLLVASREGAALEAMIDLVATLAVGRSLFGQRPRLEDGDGDAGCDIALAVRAVRGAQGDGALAAAAHPFALSEARRHAKRLRSAFGVRGERPAFDRGAVVAAALAADPRLAHVARQRGKRTMWSNGGTEIELARESAVQSLLAEAGPGRPPPEAIVVFDTHAMGFGSRGGKVLATCATAVRFAELAGLGLGRERAAGVKRKQGTLLATVQRVYARAVLSEEEREPRGELARQAVATLWLRGGLWRESLQQSRKRLLARSLAARLGQSPRGRELGFDGVPEPPSVEEFVAGRLESLGLESGQDLALLEPADLTAEELPYELRAALESEYPMEVSVGDATYAVDYDLEQRQVLLRLVRGGRRTPPPAGYLPGFQGFRICVEAGGTTHVVRGGRG